MINSKKICFEVVPDTRLQGLDILRSIAIILVFMSHYGFVTGVNPFGIFQEFGGLGVVLFFVLSGYLIGNQIFKPLTKNEPLNLKNFYIRRFLRILPAYYFVIIIYFIFPFLQEKPITEPLWKFLTFTMNFGTNLIPHGIGFSHAWSLCIEEHFYILFPILAIFILRKNSNKNFLYLLGFFLVLTIILRGLSYKIFVEAAAPNNLGRYYMKYIYYPTYTRLDGLLFGIFSSFIKNFYPIIWQKIINIKFSNLYILMGIAGIYLTYLFFHSENLRFYSATFAYTTEAFSCFMLLMSALSPNSILYKIKIPGANTLATLSYAVYLMHKILIYLTFQFLSNHLNSYNKNYLCVLVAALSSISCAWILYRLIELPFLNLRDKLTIQKKKAENIFSNSLNLETAKTPIDADKA